MIEHLVPRPRELRVDDPTVVLPADRLADTVLAGVGPDSEPWRLLVGERPEKIGPEGYILHIGVDHSVGHGADRGCARVILAAADEAGLFHGRATLDQLVDAGDPVPELTIRDWPYLAGRGVIEGFYGTPWSHNERLDFLRFAERVGLNEYVYAPKDDPYHRERWREPYPESEIAEIAELAGEAVARHVRFVYTIAPALSMRFCDDDEHALLVAKAEQLWDAGIRSFALLFDDVPGELTHPEDITAFGGDARATGTAHGLACTRFRDDFLLPHGVTEPLAMCPTDYAGCARSPYRDGLAATLPKDALVMWTGSDIVVGTVTREDIDAAAASYRRRLLLWDNFPVNDFDRSRLFLGPLRGRTTRLAGSALVGIISNPMVEAAPSRFALASVADWAWNPEAYDPEESSERARVAIVGHHARAVATLVAACSAWPPSAPQNPELKALVADALADDDDALDGLEAAMGILATVGERDAQVNASIDDALHRSLEPWFAAARDAGRAGVLACVLLRRLHEEPAEAPTGENHTAENHTAENRTGENYSAERDALLDAQARAESHYPNILRSILPGFVATVLARAGLEDVAPPPRRQVTVLTGENPVPGDRDLSERLTARGFGVALSHQWDPAHHAGADLVIVTPRASAEAAQALAAAPVPVLAWGRLDTLGLASSSGVLLSQEAIDVIAPGHPLSNTATGRVRVYRGPGKITWSAPSSDGVVIAHTVDEGQPVIVHYPSGSLLPSAAPAAADRVVFFLADDGLAPWLIAPEGYALFAAAVDLLSTSETALTTVVAA